MKNSKSIETESGTFTVEGPMQKVAGAQDKKNAFTEDESDIAWQYARCVDPENPEILCFVLKNPEDQTAGFLGLAMSEVSYSRQPELYISIEFVYLKPQFRRLKLSRYLFERALDVVVLESKFILSEFASLKVKSFAQARSNEGLRFVARWDMALQDFCEESKVDFWSEILSSLDDSE